MQVTTHFEDGKYFECNIPNEDREVFSGVRWGRVNRPYTPAFWRFICIAKGAIQDQSLYHLGNTLKEEVVACLLGGHGVKGELGLAAFHHLLENNAVDQAISQDRIEKILREPLIVGGK